MRHRSDESRRILGNRKDERVLKYLRQMISVCRRKNHRDLRFTYEHAWDFATDVVYGKLPPRLTYPMPAIPPPQPKQLTRSQVEMLARPMRKVISALEQDGSFYLKLDCGHILCEYICDRDAPAPKRRRCAECVSEAAAKKPNSSATVRTKAVSA